MEKHTFGLRGGCLLDQSVGQIIEWKKHLLPVLPYYNPQHKRLCFAMAEEQTTILGLPRKNISKSSLTRSTMTERGAVSVFSAERITTSTTTWAKLLPRSGGSNGVSQRDSGGGCGARAEGTASVLYLVKGVAPETTGWPFSKWPGRVGAQMPLPRMFSISSSDLSISSNGIKSNLI